MRMPIWKRHLVCRICNISHGILKPQWFLASAVSNRGLGDHASVQRNFNTASRPLIYRVKTKFVALRTCPRRTLFLDSVPTLLLPPVAFIGLFIALWTYKCMMMVLFQDKIIYMPYIPPFSRSEKLDDYTNQCKPIVWKTIRIRSLDNTKIALCVGSIPSQESKPTDRISRHIVICYFQGNGSSLPPRLPMLSNVLKIIDSDQHTEQCPATKYTIVALSYRGYWTSSGRASQAGIELDASAVLAWIESEFNQEDIEVVVWGQSIGAGVASVAVAAHVSQGERQNKRRISGLILETPFSSIRSMLSAMYPQKWLPYGYLWPFLWNHWDSEQALDRISKQKLPPKVLLIAATKDEIVPPIEVSKLERLCYNVGLNMQRHDIQGALHTEATSRRAGQALVAKFVMNVASD